MSQQVKALLRRAASALRQSAGLLRGAARAVAATIAECHWAAARLIELRLSPDRYLSNPDEPPRSYAEFLYRTSGLLTHEPPASKRFVSPGRRR